MVDKKKIAIFIIESVFAVGSVVILELNSISPAEIVCDNIKERIKSAEYEW